ncbi:MAG TPA: CHAT domain-containing protein, partial [Thermoanaerobaculia bacterium]|nr:CHAT domain-containing protein [Thermoanaerobaculia bacterium]
PKDAVVLSQLAAAYVVRAQRQDEPYDLVLALGAADRAVAADPALHEARFNRALTLELLFLHQEAQAAWSEYLVLDPSSPWAAEAEKRKAALSVDERAVSWDAERVRLDRTTDEEGIRRIVRSHPQSAREHAEIELLGRWSDASIKGDAAAASRIARTLRLLGDALAAVNGEHLVRDTAAVLEQAAGDRKRWDLLVQGHGAFRDGYRLYKEYDNEKALERMEAARKSLESAGSPFAARAAFFHACAKHKMDRYVEASQELRRLESRLPPGRYPALRAHIGWMLGLSLGLTGRSMEAVRSSQEALSLFEKAGEEQNAAAVRSLLTELLEELGASREAWKHGYRALRSSQALGGDGAARAFGRAADAVLQEGFPAVAIYFQDEAVRQALAAGDPVLLADALYWRAQMRGRTGERDAALDDLAQARKAIEGETDPAVRRQTLAHIAMIEGELAADSREAVALLTSALDYYRQADHPLLARAAYTARARAYRRLDEDALAEADLQAGLRASEILGEDLSQEEIRLAFLNRTDELFDEMIELQVTAKNRPDVAFFYADRARTRVLPTLRSSKGESSRILRDLPQPLPWEEILKGFPVETTLVQFSVLEDRLLIWLVRQGRMQLVNSPVSLRQLEGLARSVRSREGALSDLFDLLVLPWYGEIRAGESLVFVPDKVLHAVPFSALRDRRTGRYLVEDHRITVAPSATLYLNALVRDRRFGMRTNRRALVVGDPAFDRSLFSDLSDLSAAKVEGTEVAGLYPDSDLLIGERADVKTFLSLAPAARRIHFAGHAVVNDRNPLLSMLVFAPRNGSSGALYARDVYQLDLKNTELVVLSACSTAALPRAGSEGVTNLARAFLAAGVPSVVASLWEVDDRLTAKLSEAFHRSLLAYDDPASALRDAQLSLLHDPDEMTRSPRTWGAFEVFGGSAQKPFHP